MPLHCLAGSLDAVALRTLPDVLMPLHYLAGSLDAVADAEEDDEPGKDETERQVPLDAAQLLDTARDVEYLAPACEYTDGRVLQYNMQCVPVLNCERTKQAQPLKCVLTFLLPEFSGGVDMQVVCSRRHVSRDVTGAIKQ